MAQGTWQAACELHRKMTGECHVRVYSSPGSSPGTSSYGGRMTRALALLSCAACLLLSHAAWAKPKVALTQIEGDASGDVRDAVAEALEGKELSLIGSREVNRAVDKLGDLADLTEKDFKKLASELEADAVVAGKLDKVGSAKTLRFRVLVHKKMAKGF